MDAHRWHRRFMRWARIEDEEGQLSLTGIAFGAGVYCLVTGKPVQLADLTAFAVALGAHQLKGILRHRRAMAQTEASAEQAQQQIQIAHEQTTLEKTTDAEELGRKVAELDRRVRELATPERMDKLAGLGRRPGG
jgi:uncharacterized protein HemX